ncbi:MAG TPA: DUF4465 domain-containing protein [Bacteroidales bacterium]|nr:DUF4465 domain-containing protein [Bacteroidales bacterium]
MKSIKFFVALSVASCVLFSSCGDDDDDSVVENFNSLAVPSVGFWNGSDNAGSFSVSGITFPNSYATFPGGYYSWNGFAYSNMHDLKTPEYSNQYSSYALKDSGSRNTFVVAYPYVEPQKYENNALVFDSEVSGVTVKVTNTTLVALSMKNGTNAKKFGGLTGNDPDWFKLQIIGFDKNSQPTDTVDFYLADYRFEDNTKDYIVNDWKVVNLSTLGVIKKIKFALSSTDNNANGMLTPGYFCLDDIKFESLSVKE